MSNENEGSSMSKAEVASLLGVPNTPEVVQAPNDIYKINARVKNKAREISGGHLTPVGDILCNSMSHVLKKLYEFADTLTEADKDRLKALLVTAEEMPGNVIWAGRRGLKPPEKK